MANMIVTARTYIMMPYAPMTNEEWIGVLQQNQSLSSAGHHASAKGSYSRTKSSANLPQWYEPCFFIVRLPRLVNAGNTETKKG